MEEGKAQDMMIDPGLGVPQQSHGTGCWLVFPGDGCVCVCVCVSVSFSVFHLCLVGIVTFAELMTRCEWSAHTSAVTQESHIRRFVYGDTSWW